MALFWAEWQSYLRGKKIQKKKTDGTHSRHLDAGTFRQPPTHSSWISQSQVVADAEAYVSSIVSIQLHSCCWAVYAKRRAAVIRQRTFKKTVSEFRQMRFEWCWMVSPLCGSIFHQTNHRAKKKIDEILRTIEARKYAFHYEWAPHTRATHKCETQTTLYSERELTKKNAKKKSNKKL